MCIVKVIEGKNVEKKKIHVYRSRNFRLEDVTLFYWRMEQICKTH